MIVPDGAVHESATDALPATPVRFIGLPGITGVALHKQSAFTKDCLPAQGSSSILNFTDIPIRDSVHDQNVFIIPVFNGNDINGPKPQVNQGLICQAQLGALFGVAEIVLLGRLSPLVFFAFTWKS